MPISNAGMDGTQVAGLIAIHKAIAGDHHPRPITMSGTYTGNDAAARAIAHGAGIKPLFVIILGPLYLGFYSSHDQNHLKTSDFAGNETITTMTAMTASNFYVGHASSYPKTMNSNTVVYYWFSVG